MTLDDSSIRAASIDNPRHLVKARRHPRACWRSSPIKEVWIALARLAQQDVPRWCSCRFLGPRVVPTHLANDAMDPMLYEAQLAPVANRGISGATCLKA